MFGADTPLIKLECYIAELEAVSVAVGTHETKRQTVTEPRAVATGPNVVGEIRGRCQAGRYRSRFCNDPNKKARRLN